MPHVGAASGGDDLASSDEIKVFKEEGDDEDNRSSENLAELKTSLVTEGEEEKSSDIPGPNEYGSPSKNSDCRPDSASHSGKSFDLLPPHSGPIGYVVSPYPHPHNGSLGPVSMDIYPEGFSKSTMYQILRETETRHNLEMARNIDIFPEGLSKEEMYQISREREAKFNMDLGRQLAGKVSMVPPHSGSPLPFMVYNGEPFAQPPPAHMGIPPVGIDPKTGIPRPPVYHLGPPGQYPPVFSPEFTHHWHTPALYPTTSAGFRSAYSSALPVTSASLPRFSPPTLITPYPGISHPALITSGPKQEIALHHSNHRSLPDYPNEQKYNAKAAATSSTNSSSTVNNGEKKAHIKKPLNAFMLYMKEMRAKVVAECTLKESAAINQILGRRWHSLSREEQAKYYEMARKERQLHMQLYPGWSARDNYALQVKKKKRKKDRNQDGDGNNLKKCRARFGLDQQSNWCKPCRRKKKCIRYKDGGGGDQAFESEDNMGSAGSVEAPTPDSKADEDTDSRDTEQGSPRLISPPQHHPLSVHQLIQPHCPSRGRFPPPPLTVT